MRIILSYSFLGIVCIIIPPTSILIAKVGPDTKAFSSWAFSNIYFLDNMTDNLLEPNLNKDIPEALYIMNHVYRSIEIVQHKTFLKMNKCFFPQER